MCVCVCVCVCLENEYIHIEAQYMRQRKPGYASLIDELQTLLGTAHFLARMYNVYVAPELLAIRPENEEQQHRK